MDANERYGDGLWADCRLYSYNASWKRVFAFQNASHSTGWPKK